MQGLTLRDTGGDAISLSVNLAYTTNSNVVFRDLFCENNYRQGISVASVENLLIENCIIRHTWGTAPQCGIDFEPNYDYDKMINCVVRNCVLEGNHVAGLLLNMFSYVDTDAVTGSAEHCTIIGNRLYGIKYTVPLPNWQYEGLFDR